MKQGRFVLGSRANSFPLLSAPLRFPTKFISPFYFFFHSKTEQDVNFERTGAFEVTCDSERT